MRISAVSIRTRLSDSESPGGGGMGPVGGTSTEVSGWWVLGKRTVPLLAQRNHVGPQQARDLRCFFRKHLFDTV